MWKIWKILRNLEKFFFKIQKIEHLENWKSQVVQMRRKRSKKEAEWANFGWKSQFGMANFHCISNFHLHLGRALVIIAHKQ